jgi:hypothetical protein
MASGVLEFGMAVLPSLACLEICGTKNATPIGEWRLSSRGLLALAAAALAAALVFVLVVLRALLATLLSALALLLRILLAGLLLVLLGRALIAILVVGHRCFPLAIALLKLNPLRQFCVPQNPRECAESELFFAWTIDLC